MNSDDLALFAQVARSGGISRAAIELGADQSTVSRRISLLEADLGVRLFQRTGRGVTLTEAGQQLIGYATTLAATLTEAEEAMRNTARQGPARFCIAAQPTIARVLFGTLGHALKDRYPLTQVRFIEGLASQILPLLNDGEVDLAILYLPEHPGGLQFELLLKEEIRLITPADYPLNRDSFELRDLGDIPLILPSTHHGLRVLVESLAARHGFVPNIALECDGSISITQRLVAERCGCTVLPTAAVVERVNRGELRNIPLVPAVKRDVAICWPKNRVTPDGLTAITQIIRQRAAELVRSGAWPDTSWQSAPPPGP